MKMVVVIMVTIMVRHQLFRTNLLLLKDPREISTRYDPSEYVLIIDGGAWKLLWHFVGLTQGYVVWPMDEKMNSFDENHTLSWKIA